MENKEQIIKIRERMIKELDNLWEIIFHYTQNMDYCYEIENAREDVEMLLNDFEKNLTFTSYKEKEKPYEFKYIISKDKNLFKLEYDLYELGHDITKSIEFGE